jgi:hypothetical protein
LQHIKLPRAGERPVSRRFRRIGADAAFAKAMARSEFGKFYTDDDEQREVCLSMLRAKGRLVARAKRPPPEAREPEAQQPKPSRPLTWAPPTPRHRRTEIADATARLKLAARLRKKDGHT